MFSISKLLGKFSSRQSRSTLTGSTFLIYGVLSAFASLNVAEAQSTGARFDVVAIHELDPNGPPRMVDPDYQPVAQGQYSNPVTWLPSLISFAYDIRTPDLNLEGLPKWAREKEFSVMAKRTDEAEELPETNRERVREMVRNMLADRFKLKIHPDDRPSTILKLELSKRGFQSTEQPEPVPPEKEGRVNMSLGDRGGRMLARKAKLSGLAGVLSIFLKQPVVNATGLEGYYDFDLKWTADPSANPRPGLGAEGIALLISMLDDQLGLVLKKTEGTMRVWVVDSIEMPAEN